MMRPIDADALKKDLMRFYDNEVTARELIDEQPTIEAEPDNGWISVKDRLPELYENVLVIDSDGKIYISWIAEITETKSYFAYGSGSITHWQPLPEPPKGE